MQRNTSTWVYFLTLLLGIAMTVALLPACGGGGGGGGCNSELGEIEGEENEGAEVGCELEEIDEEELADAEEDFDEQREETGEPGSAEIRAHELEDLDELL
jgi:hypothetical protein